MRSIRSSVALACVAIMLLVSMTGAFAEVCDKAVGDDWMPEHGPVWLLNPVGWPLGLMSLLGGLVLAATWSKWIGYVGAAFLVSLVALGILASLVPSDDRMYRMLVEEGCVSPATGWANVGVFALFALAYGWLGLRRHRIEVRRIMAARQNDAAALNV